MQAALILLGIAAFIVLWVVALGGPVWRYIRRDKHRCENCGLSVLNRHRVCPYCGHVLGTHPTKRYDQEQFLRRRAHKNNNR